MQELRLLYHSIDYISTTQIDCWIYKSSMLRYTKIHDFK